MHGELRYFYGNQHTQGIAWRVWGYTQSHMVVLDRWGVRAAIDPGKGKATCVRAVKSLNSTLQLVPSGDLETHTDHQQTEN